MNSERKALRGISTALLAALWLIGFVSASAQEQQPPQSSEVPKIVRKSEEVLREIATKRVDAAYPPRARAAQVFGAVTVEVTIDESGDVVSARAVSGQPLLHDAAVKAALGWKFQPTTIQGAPVRVIGNITFYFTNGPTIEAAEKAVQEHPDSAQAYYDLSVVLAGNGHRREAIQAVKDAIKVDPNFQNGYVQLGNFLQAEGADHEAEAIDALKQAIRLDPHDFRPQLMLAGVYSTSRRFEEAVELYEGAIKENPRLTLEYIFLGAAYAELGKWDQAEEAYKLVIQERPSEVNAYIGLGNLYVKVGRTTEAIATLRRAVALGPRYLDAHFALGMAYAKSGDKKSALEEYESLKKYMPRRAEELLKAINE